MKTAIIATGGKQYLVQEDDEIDIEKISTKSDKIITFEDVLLVISGKTVKIGTPNVARAKVEAQLTRQKHSPKIIGVKMKSKKRYRRLFGHRQHLMQVKITKIQTA